MNKTILSIFAGACCMVLFSCDTPKDQRPENKASVRMVPPGTRNTSNLETVKQQGHEPTHEIIPNHDPGENEMAPANRQRMNDARTNSDSIRNHE